MSTQTCLTCPSVVWGQEAADIFDVSVDEVGAFIFCSRYGYVLGNDSGVREGFADKYGASCVSHGKQPPSKFNLAGGEAKAYIPRPELLVQGSNQSSCTSCNTCTKLDKPNGGTPTCAATGQLVPSAIQDDVASTCFFRDYGTPKEKKSVPLDSWQTTAVAISNLGSASGTTSGASPTASPASSEDEDDDKSFVILEPVDYNSDAKVLAEHTKLGIKAWRKVTSPMGRDHFLPIFDTAFFSEEEQSRIPKSGSDYGDPSLFIDHDNILVEFAVQSYTKDLNLCLIGDPGSGKTEGARFVAWELNMPFDRITYNEDTDPDEVLGFHHFGEHEVVADDGSVKTVTGTYFKMGILPRAWQKMQVLLSDEPNIAKEAIVQSYRSMNDSSRELIVAGEKFRRHDYCFHIMAMNPHYDFRNIGAKPMASADSRRLSFHFVSPPNDEQIKQILTRAIKTLDKGASIDPEVMKIIIAAGRDLRQMVKDNLLPDFWTTSQEVKVARLVPDFGILGAYRRAYFNYIDPQTTEVAMRAIESHIPSGFALR